MFSPFVDALLTGGLSLVVLGAVAIAGISPLKGHDYGTLFTLGLLCNWPHFIASYRMLYATPQSISRYRLASTWVPLFLGAWCLAAIVLARRYPAFANTLLIGTSVYLARHYTGQTWGMMASFAHLTATPFAAVERRLIRLSLDLLMVWHGIWAATQTVGLVSARAASWFRAMYPHSHWLRLAALILGAVGLTLYARRHRRLPPIRVLLPWAAIQVWYVLLAEDPSAILAIQIAHALQYLPFPLRITLNRASDGQHQRRALLLAYAAWTLVGIAVFEGLEPLFRLGFSAGGGTGGLPAVASTAVISAIGMHHYFVDGALYKLRNPEVRRDLFAHVKAP